MDPKLIVLAIFLGFGALEILTRRFHDPARSGGRDIAIELISTLTIILITVPAIFYGAAFIAGRVAPGSEGALSHWPWWAMAGVLLVVDDMTQYWWHRASHSFPWLYNLHRAHHSGGYMSVRIAYRNNLFYYALMPGIWASAVLVHLGFGAVYAVYLIIKMSVIFGAHSSWRWDEALYRLPLARSLMWVIERTISTPATHAAHHGQHAEDGVTHYKGNYGNLLFFWDVLFGTAKITRRYPEQYGIEGLDPVTWKRELFWPLVRR